MREFSGRISARAQKLVVGFSDDAVNWTLEDKYIFDGYDPRLCEIDGKYYLSWVNPTPHGTTIGIAFTEDFKSWTQLEDACYPVARNGVLFPRKINGEYLLLIRPCDRGLTAISLSAARRISLIGANTALLWAPLKIGKLQKSERVRLLLKPTRAG